MIVSRLRLLVLSNMWPSEQKPYSGIFVKNQVDKYARDKRVLVEHHCLKRSFTGIVGSAIKYFIFFVSFVAKHLLRHHDVVHVHYFFPTVILGVIYRFFHPNTLLVVTFHGTDVTHFMEEGRLRSLGKLLIRYVDIGIAVSESLAFKVNTALDFECAYVFSAGVREDVFYPVADTRKDFDLVFVGSFIKRKGVDLLVAALDQVDTSRLKIGFVGSGELVNEIRSLDGFHQVTLFESVTQEELRDIFCRSRFHVLPSRYEPFGLVVTEAMYCGVPVIATRIGGVPAQIEDGVNGWLIEPDDIDAVREKIVHAIDLSDERYNAMVKKCLESNKHNALSIVCEEQLQIYNSRAEGGRQ